MADKKLSFPSPSLSSPSHQNGRIGGAIPTNSPAHHLNGSLDPGPGPCNTSPIPQPCSAPSGRNSVSTSPLRTLRTLRSLATPVPGSGPESSSGSTRPRGQSLGSALSARTRTTAAMSKSRSTQLEEQEALLDLILETQGQRLDDQRASLSLLPDPGPVALCGTCSPDQPHLPSLDFYYMLIHYQSDRMEDQRFPLPELTDVAESGPEGQEDFFSLIHRVQSRRMDEQRASLLITHTEDDDDTQSTGSSPYHHHH